MARYKPYNLKQDKWIPLSYADQIMPGSFEYALNEIVEEHLDLSVLERRYRNDDTGRVAYDPKAAAPEVGVRGCARAATASRDRMHSTAGPERGGHHAVVSSSRFTFPRH